MTVIEIKTYWKLDEFVKEHAMPGNERRSLLGMIGTRGEYCIIKWAEKVMRKLTPTHFPIVCYWENK